MSTLMPCNSLMAFSLFAMETLNFSTCCRLLSSCCRFLSRLPCSSIRCCFIDSCSSLTFSGDWTILWLSFCPFSSAWVMASLILSCQYKCPCANKESQIKWFQVIYMFRKLGDIKYKGVMPAVQSFSMYRYIYLNKILIWKSYLQYHKFVYEKHFFMHVCLKIQRGIVWPCVRPFLLVWPWPPLQLSAFRPAVWDVLGVFHLRHPTVLGPVRKKISEFEQNSIANLLHTS